MAKSANDPVRPARDAPRSPFFAWAFWLICILYIVGVEAFCRAATGQGVTTLLPAWLEKGEGRVVLFVMWLIATPAAVALLADHVRNVYVALTGRPEGHVFLGDRLREGFYVVRESGLHGRPQFVEHFVAREEYPSLTFHAVYLRRILLRDAEGNLTAAEMLSTGRTVIFTVAQLFLLMLSASPWISIAGQYQSGFTIRGNLPQAMGALALPDGFLAGVLAVLVVFYLGSIAAMAWATRKSGGAARLRVLPLPKSVASGATLAGTVVASETYTIDNTDRDANSARFYRRYAICFSGPDFPLPVYLNWSSQRVHKGNISVTAGKRTRELERQKAYFDGVFEHLDRAMQSGVPVRFLLDADLALVPKPGIEPAARAAGGASD